MHDVPPETLIVAGIALAIGAAMLLWVQRRKFYRRNVCGLETFQSFGGMLVTRCMEGIVALVGFVLVVLNGIYLLGYLTSPR